MIPKNYMKKPQGWKMPEKKVLRFSGVKHRADEIRKVFFNESSTFLDHLNLQKDADSYPIYLSVLLVLLHQNCELQFHTKWKTLACAFVTRHYDLVDFFLYKTTQFNMPEILKSIKFLDIQRYIRQLKKRIDRLEKCGAKRTTINKVKSKITELEKESIPESVYKINLPGSITKRIRKWVGKFTESELAFFSIQMPKKPWKELSDLVHFSPKDFQLPYFLPVAFGAKPPEDSIIAVCETITMKNVEEIVTKFKIPYSFLRKKIPKLNKKTKEIVAGYEKIDTIIWYYEEFTSDGRKEIDKIVLERLNKGDMPSFNYGKLLERILYFKMVDLGIEVKAPEPAPPMKKQTVTKGGQMKTSEGTGWLREIIFHGDDPSLETVTVIVTTSEGSSYDNLFRNVQQRVPRGRVSIYNMQTRGHAELLKVMKGEQQPKDPKVIKFMKEVESLDPDCVLFNWECSSGCGDQGFKSTKVIDLVEVLLERGHVLMFSDFAVKALIGKWDESKLGPKSLVKLRQCSTSMELHFDNEVLGTCDIPQLEAVGRLSKGTANLHCMGGTIVVGVDHDKAKLAKEQGKYELQVLTVAGKVDGQGVSKHMHNCEMGSNVVGTLGHAVLRYSNGGQIIISSGHWIELKKLDTSIEKVEQFASQYGDEYNEELNFLKDPNIPMEEKKRKLQELSKLFVQQMPAAKSKKKKMKKKEVVEEEEEEKEKEVKEEEEENEGEEDEDEAFYELLIPLAEKKLESIDLPLEKPFYIFGDSSASMGVCVRTSTIISSFISCITDAKLKFFNYLLMEPKYQPKTITDVIDIALTTKAIGETAPAYIISDFYKKKKIVKVFLVVTDEVENCEVEGMYFAQHFYRYYTEVYPAKLVMVSFLNNPSQFDSGQMVKALKSFGIEPAIFSMHLIRPDLQKLDKLVGLLSLETTAFLDTVCRVQNEAKKGGMKSALEELKKKTKKGEDEEEVEGEEEEEDNKGSQKKVEEKKKKEDEEEDDDGKIPDEFLCPITKVLMKDPVVCSDGYTYEREAIVKWMDTKKTSPMTGSALTETIVFPNHGLKSKIVEFNEKKKKK